MAHSYLSCHAKAHKVLCRALVPRPPLLPPVTLNSSAGLALAPPCSRLPGCGCARCAHTYVSPFLSTHHLAWQGSPHACAHALLLTCLQASAGSLKSLNTAYLHWGMPALPCCAEPARAAAGPAKSPCPHLRPRPVTPDPTLLLPWPAGPLEVPRLLTPRLTQHRQLQRLQCPPPASAPRPPRPRHGVPPWNARCRTAGLWASWRLVAPFPSVASSATPQMAQAQPPVHPLHSRRTPRSAAPMRPH